MTAAERVEKIRAISDALEGQSYGDIDLTLDQFGLPTSESWSGSKRDYVLQHAKGCTDQALTDLHDYLCPTELPTTEPPPAQVARFGAVPWETDSYRLFLSHVSGEKKNVAELRDALRLHSIEGFVAHDSIEPGAEWQDVILSALDTCHGVAAWLTPKFSESNWCDQEVGYAVAKGE